MIMKGKYQNNSDIIASCYRPPCADCAHQTIKQLCCRSELARGTANKTP
jgi:hypothetical protein